MKIRIKKPDEDVVFSPPKKIAHKSDKRKSKRPIKCSDYPTSRLRKDVMSLSAKYSLDGNPLKFTKGALEELQAAAVDRVSRFIAAANAIKEKNGRDTVLKRDFDAVAVVESLLGDAKLQPGVGPQNKSARRSSTS